MTTSLFPRTRPGAVSIIPSGRRTLAALLLGCAFCLTAGPISPAAAQEILTTDTLNVRACPSLECEVFGVVPAGHCLPVQSWEAGGQWVRIPYQGKSGFVSAQFTQPWCSPGVTREIVTVPVPVPAPAPGPGPVIITPWTSLLIPGIYWHHDGHPRGRPGPGWQAPGPVGPGWLGGPGGPGGPGRP